MSISFAKSGKFFFIIFSSKFLISCSSSSLSGIPMIWRLVHLEMSQRLLILSLFFFEFLFLLAVWLNEFFINLINYLHFIRIFFFWFVFLVSSFETYSSVFSLCLIFCVCFCELDKTNTSPDPEGVALRMSNLPVDRDCWVVLAGCWSLRG